MSQNGSSSNDLAFGVVLGIIITIGITLIIDKNSEKNLRILQAQQQIENSKNTQPKAAYDHEADKTNREILAALEKLSKSNKDTSELQLYKLELLISAQNAKIEDLKNQWLAAEKSKQSENDELSKKIDRVESSNQAQIQRIDFLQKQLSEAQKTNESLLATQKQILESIKNQKVEVRYLKDPVSPAYVAPEVSPVAPKENLPQAAEVKTYDPVKKDLTKPKLVRTLPPPEKQPAFKPNDRLE